MERHVTVFFSFQTFHFSISPVKTPWTSSPAAHQCTVGAEREIKTKTRIQFFSCQFCSLLIQAACLVNFTRLQLSRAFCCNGSFRQKNRRQWRRTRFEFQISLLLYVQEHFYYRCRHWLWFRSGLGFRRYLFELDFSFPQLTFSLKGSNLSVLGLGFGGGCGIGIGFGWGYGIGWGSKYIDQNISFKKQFFKQVRKTSFNLYLFCQNL